MLIGFGIGMAVPLLGDSPALYAAQLAGVVVSLTVFYALARLFYRRRQRRKGSAYAERLA